MRKRNVFFRLVFAVLLIPAVLLVSGVLLMSCDRYGLRGRIVRFEQEMESYRAETNNVGLVVVFVRNYEVAYMQHWGELDEDQLIRVASISKTFTATGLMQLVEKGVLRTDMDASDLLGYRLRNPQYPDRVITLEMLMSHTSSVNARERYNDYAPGEGYQYCDYNYTLCGEILERASGEPFDTYIREHILRPMQIAGDFQSDSLDRSRLAHLYQWEDDHYECTDEWAYDARVSPASGMKISAKDLTRYMLMHMRHGLAANGVRILSDSLSREMQKPRSYQGAEHYGLGLLETEMFSPGTVLTGHSAGAYGMRGVMYFRADEGYGFIVLSNGSHDPQHDDENMVHFGTIRRMFDCFAGEE